MTIDERTIKVLRTIADMSDAIDSRACLIAFLFLRTSEVGICMAPNDLVRFLDLDDSGRLNAWMMDEWSKIGTWEREENPIDTENTRIILALNP